MNSSAYLTDFSTTDDALVLASVSSKAEFDLLNDWLQAQRRAHPDTKVEVLRLPHGDPPPQLVSQLVSQLNAGEDRTVVPVRVFWVPGGLPTRVKLVGLISGRDTYRPPEVLQRAILRKDPSRARIVAGAPDRGALVGAKQGGGCSTGKGGEQRGHQNQPAAADDGVDKSG